MKCQICNTEENVQIHHPNYKDYLKINLLCKKHHDKLHNFELVPPSIIDLEKIAIKKPPQKEKTEFIESQIETIKNDISNKGLSYNQLTKKYQISSSTIKRYLSKGSDWEDLKEILERAGEKNKKQTNLKHPDNPLQQYRIKHDLTAKQLSEITGIAIPTIRAIECGRTNIRKVRPVTREKLKKIEVV